MNALLIIFLAAIAALFISLTGRKLLAVYLGVIGLAAGLISLYMPGYEAADWLGVPLDNMLKFDSFSRSFSAVAIVITLLILLIGTSDRLFRVTGEMTSLMLFSLCGALCLFSFGNMFMLFLGIEILSIPLYVLAGTRKNDLAGNEASFKYFLMGAFATGILLFGITLVYGATGKFGIQEIADKIIQTPNAEMPMLLKAGVIMMMAALCFKIGAVPFHFWAPDVYTGAPAIVTLFMSTVVKIAGVAAFFKLFTTAFAPIQFFWGPALAVIAAASIILGNFTALFQQNFKRTLAYSSISHAGFMLMGIVALSYVDANLMLYYLLAYSLASVPAFGLLLHAGDDDGHETYEFRNFSGLSGRSPLMALAVAGAVFSMAGIPPLAGFMGKFSLFNAAFNQNYLWLLIVALVASAVSIAYYFRIIGAMYFSKERGSAAGASGNSMVIAISAVSLLALLLLGLFPGWISQF